MRKKAIYKMIILAIKNPDKEYIDDFDALEILDLNRDFDWAYECSKTNKIQRFVKSCIDSGDSIKDVKKYLKQNWNEIIDKLCFYDCFIDKAKLIVKRYKGRC